MFIKNKEIMNKSALFRLKLSFPNVLGLVLHQWNYQFVETVARYKYTKIQGCRVPTGGVRCDQPHAPYSIKVRLLQYQ